jgi:type I restriction enzyme S subunit
LFQSYAQRFATGATIKNLGLKAVRDYEFYLPPLKTQKRIADILNAYDNLIENNLKRITLLEQAAQNIYKEWFVNMRFPGHEKIEIQHQANLPIGWFISMYSEHFDVVTGKKDANHASTDGNYPFFTCGRKIIKSPDYSFDCDAILLAGNGDFNVKYYRGKFQAYQRTYVLSPFNNEEFFYLYTHLKLNLKRLTNGSKGSVIKYLTKGMIADFQIIMPTSDVLKEYNEIVNNMFSQIENLESQIVHLSKARDILLPRLMNQTIKV